MNDFSNKTSFGGLGVRSSLAGPGAPSRTGDGVLSEAHKTMTIYDSEYIDTARFRGLMAALKKGYSDFTVGDSQIARIRKGETNINFKTLIEAGKTLGVKPFVIWVPIDGEVTPSPEGVSQSSPERQVITSTD